MRPLLLAVLTLAACGGSDQDLTTAFNGSWSRRAFTVTPVLDQLTPPPVPAVVEVSGRHGTVSGVCWDGGGTVPVEGSGVAASWRGSLECPLPASATLGGCTSLTLRVEALSVTVRPSGASRTLELTGTGTLVGCGQSAPSQIGFVGFPWEGVPPGLTGTPAAAP